MEAAGQVRSVYLTMVYREFGNIGGVLHEIQISKDGMLLTKSTQKKPARPDRVLFDKTQFPEEPTNPFISGVRIGSKLHLFAGIYRHRGLAYTTLGSTFDPKSLGEDQLVPFHDLPNVKGTCPVIMSAHGRLYHLAIHQESWDLPIHFEVYDPSTKSWALLTRLPRSPYRPYARSQRWYLGYAVWGTCILVSFGYPAALSPKVLFAPVLYNAESGTWHQVDVEDPWGGTFPWRDKAVVVGDTMYALGMTMGSIISLSINKSGSEEDGTLVYSLRRPYILSGLNVIPHPKYWPRKRTMQCLTPLSDSEFCLVQTITNVNASKSQPIWITTFRIIRKEGTFSKIQTLHSTFLFMNNQNYGHFEPVFCYNPDYEPEEAMLTTIRKERNKKEGSYEEVEPKEASLANRKENGEKEMSSSCMVDCSSPLSEPNEESLTNEKVDMQNEASRVSLCNVECVKQDFELGGESTTKINKGVAIEIKNSFGFVDSNSWDFESKESLMINSKNVKTRKKKVKRSKRKGTKRDSYIVALVKHQVSNIKSFGRTYAPIGCLIILCIGLLFGFLLSSRKSEALCHPA